MPPSQEQEKQGMNMIELNGALGEGGGQVLRSSLTLSMITGQPFRIANIRANRSKPGLMRQHLVAVQAAAKVSDAVVTGGEIGSTALTFAPRGLRAGDYEFAINSAGSCTLVLQTILPALLFAGGPSTVRISGGTHNPMAPPVQFLERAYLPLLARMGGHVQLNVLRSGFYPAGGGLVQASVAPCEGLKPISVMQRGAVRKHYAEAIVAGIPGGVAERELAFIGVGMRWDESQLLNRSLPANQGPGNALLMTFEHDEVTEVFMALGERSLSSEAVAKKVMAEAKEYLASGAAVGEHLADQLMLPMALADGGEFTASVISQHALTNGDIISRFLPVRFHFGGNVVRVEKAN